MESYAVVERKVVVFTLLFYTVIYPLFSMGKLIDNQGSKKDSSHSSHTFYFQISFLCSHRKMLNLIPYIIQTISAQSNWGKHRIIFSTVCL